LGHKSIHWSDVFLACCLVFFGGTMLFVGHDYYCADYDSTPKHHLQENRQSFQHNAVIVPPKYLDML
jgi:hypothetical protein